MENEKNTKNKILIVIGVILFILCCFISVRKGISLVKEKDLEREVQQQKVQEIEARRKEELKLQQAEYSKAREELKKETEYTWGEELTQPTTEEETLVDWNSYLDYPIGSSYEMSDGTVYKMIMVDRACGSSFFSLLSTDTQGNTELVAKDPYNGSGGESEWLTFLRDEELGFSCLSNNGGNSALLFRTEDGGKTFEIVNYPSAQVELSDGTLYNPFVIPEKVYEEDSKLFLIAGQGTNGDYYGKEGFCAGLYESTDQGITWNYIGEKPDITREVLFD